MHRLFFNSKDISEDKIIISDPNLIHHIKDVLRLRVNDIIVACDEAGRQYHSLIQELSAESLLLKIQEKYNPPKNNTKITLACAIPKKSKFDDIVDKLTQLGVDRIIPMQTARVTVKLDKDKGNLRLERWKKIALAASEQSGRNNLPVIEPPVKIEDVISKSCGYDLKLIPALIDERRTLKEVFNKSAYKNILILIGPEGDFTPEEVETAKLAGFIPVTLGSLVLRVETAAVSIVSIINHTITQD